MSFSTTPPTPMHRRQDVNSPSAFIIAFSGISEETKAHLEAACIELEAQVVKGNKYDPITTHVVAKKDSCTAKALSALASGKWMMSADWVTASHKAGYFLPEERYGFHVASPPFAGQRFFITDGADPSGSLPSIIEYGGGVITQQEDADRIVVDDYKTGSEGPNNAEVTFHDLVKGLYPSRLGGTVRKVKRQPQENVRRRLPVKEESKLKRPTSVHERTKEDRKQVLEAKREIPMPPPYKETEYEPMNPATSAPPPFSFELPTATVLFQAPTTTAHHFSSPQDLPVRQDPSLFLPRVPDMSYFSPEHTVNTSSQYPLTGGEKKGDPFTGPKVSEVAKSLHFRHEPEVNQHSTHQQPSTTDSLFVDPIFHRAPYTIETSRVPFDLFDQESNTSEVPIQHQPKEARRNQSPIVSEDDPTTEYREVEHPTESTRSGMHVSWEDQQKPSVQHETFQRPAKFVPESKKESKKDYKLATRRIRKESGLFPARWLMMVPIILMVLFAYRLAKPAAPLTADELFIPARINPMHDSHVVPHPTGGNQRVEIFADLEEQPEAESYVNYLWKKLSASPHYSSNSGAQLPAIYARLTRGDHECIKFNHTVTAPDAIVVCLEETSFPEHVLQSKSRGRNVYYISKTEKTEGGEFNEEENQRAVEMIAKDLRALSK